MLSVLHDCISGAESKPTNSVIRVLSSRFKRLAFAWLLDFSCYLDDGSWSEGGKAARGGEAILRWHVFRTKFVRKDRIRQGGCIP